MLSIMQNTLYILSHSHKIILGRYNYSYSSGSIPLLAIYLCFSKYWFFRRSYTTVILRVSFPIILGILFASLLFWILYICPYHGVLPHFGEEYPLPSWEYQCIKMSLPSLLKKIVWLDIEFYAANIFFSQFWRYYVLCLSVLGMICFVSLKTFRITLSLILWNVTITYVPCCGSFFSRILPNTQCDLLLSKFISLSSRKAP